MSGRMNWERVNRENRSWREARRAPARSWEPSHNWEPYHPKPDLRPPAEATQRWPQTEDKCPAVPWGTSTSKSARERRRRRERAAIERRQTRVR